MSSLWVDKYKPSNTNDLIGQGRNVSRIKSWLRSFDSSRSKPIFIYGPPGIGKTTAAHLCCKELGYTVLEFNASDQRNKNIIKDVISTAANNTRISFTQRASNTKEAIILDEVDGMAGNEDRGGIAQLIIEMKHTKKPMIFICNDGQHPKLRSLKEKCENIEFRRPEMEALRAIITKIGQRENIPVSKINIRQLAESSDYDIRQIVNSLSLFRDGGVEQIVKTTRMNAFEAAKKALSASATFEDRFDCFFADYNIMPLFISENYQKNTNKLESISKAADMLCLGDLVEKEIRSHQTWSLLNVHALFSTVLPAKTVASGDHVSINFPQYLGKLSNINKRMRLFQEVNAHTCLSGKLDADCLETMSSRLGSDLKRKNIDSAVQFMHDYALLREDLDSIMELATWSFKPNLMTLVDTKTKTSFTAAYKKNSTALPYFVEDKPTKKKRTLADHEDDGEDDDEDEDVVVLKPKKVHKGPAPKISKTDTKSGSDTSKASSVATKSSTSSKSKSSKTSSSTTSTTKPSSSSSSQVSTSSKSSGSGSSKSSAAASQMKLFGFANPKVLTGDL